jgi:hypothetical protein
VNARPALPFNALWRTARLRRDRPNGGPAFRKKRTHTVVPLARPGLADWTAAGFARGRWADWLGSAMKPLEEYGKRVEARLPGAAFQA